MALDGRITSRRHPLIGRLRAAARHEGSEALLDGAHLLAEALRSARADDAGHSTLRVVVVTHTAMDRPEVEALCDQAVLRGSAVHLVSDALADAISPARTPTGVVALAEVQLQPLDALLTPRGPTGAASLLLVLAGVQDPGNVGTIVRSAEAAGATGVVLLGNTADPLGWKALRGSMGSALRMPLHRTSETGAALAAMRAAGLRLVAAQSATSTTPTPDLTAPLALVVGAEGRGLPDEIVSVADASVHIPIAPAVESLNVAVATALLLFEVRRCRGGPGVLP